MKHVKPGHSQPVVCLDAGHSGDSNRSPAVPQYYESDMSWTLHLLLKAALERYGIVVKATRETKNATLDVYERGAASKGCNLFLSLHTNTRSAKWLMKESNLTRLAEEEAAVIAEYFDVPEPVVERDKLYRIRAGAFRLKANAEAYLADIKAAGLDAYITTQAD